MGNNKNTIIVAVILFVLSTFISYKLFSKITPYTANSVPSTAKTANNYQALEFDSSQPKTQACPLNGVMYSKDQEKWWQGHAPLGVMIENQVDARPQSGLSFSDITYEAVAEGGITRFLAVFYCQDAGIIGPVRSARTYFLDFISEYGGHPLYTHVGGANTPGPADALGQIDDYGWGNYNDINQFSVGYPTFWRDESRQGHPVATEHTMYSTTTKLWKVAQTRGLTNVDKSGTAWDEKYTQYTFKDDAPATTPTATTINLTFWPGGTYSDYTAQWKYDKTGNQYIRSTGGQPHLDRNIGKQLSAKNVVVLWMTEKSANDGYENNLHNLYGTTGKGNAVIFMDGKQIKGTWKKASRTAHLGIYDANGAEVKFDRGHIWFDVLPQDEGNISVE